MAGTAAKRKHITKEDVRKLTRIGAQMANVMFNLAQSPERVPGEDDRERMDKLRMMWDMTRRELEL